MSADEDSLEVLALKESMAFENLSKAFIKHSLARNAMRNRLREIREGYPELFTEGKAEDVQEDNDVRRP